MTSAPTLTAFLLARIAEDEAAARAAMGSPAYDHFGDDAAEETLEMALSEGCAPEGAAHFARHDPARVLAQCAALRAVVELHSAFVMPMGNFKMSTDTLRALASVYADHPDYLEEWR
jgi:hypothetical protein